MLDIKQFLSAIKQIAEEKGIAEESVIETIEAAIAAAYKRDYGKKGQIIRAKLDTDTGKLNMTQVLYVVEGADEEGYITGPLPIKVTEDKQDFGDFEKPRRRGEEPEATEVKKGEDGELKVKFNPEKHLALADAKKKNKKIVIKSVREAERGAIFSEFKSREGEIVSGVVQRKEGQLVFVDLGKTNGLLLPIEQVYGDNYRIGQRSRFIILKVDETSRGPAVLLSRAHPKLVLELFRMEVPEIDSGSVVVKAIAREAGSRTKIAVASQEEGVDPIGSLVGQKGVRVQTVINELSGEKTDIILWSDKAKDFIANSLSPAKVLDVKIMDEKRKHSLVEVSDDQFSLAIGKRGQNVRLAAKLTAWKIDVRST